MRAIPRTAVLATTVAIAAALAACAPPGPSPEPSATATAATEPSAAPTPAPSGDDPTAQQQASTPTPTPDLSVDEAGLWRGMTAHCESVERLMQVDDHPQPLVNGRYAPVVLHDSGPRDGARGEVLTRMDGSPDAYLVAEGDDPVSIGQRFCAPHPDYIAWLSHYESAAAMQLPLVGLPISLVSSEREGEGQDMPVPTESR